MSKVLVNFVQDRSGSMQAVWDETLSGFKAFVNELREKGKQDGVEYLFSLTTFDTLVETPMVAQAIDKVDVHALKKHGPRGMTALYDAVGATIQNTDANRHGAEKIVVVIVTDGQENSSREWDKDRLHSSIDEKLKAGDWTFTYLGTQPETWADAGAFGLAATAATYTPAMAGKAYFAVAASVTRLAASKHRSSRDLMGEWLSAEERAEAGISKEEAAEKKPPLPEPPKTEAPEKKKSGRWR